MLEGLRALIAVEKLGTVSEAAVELRLTQSAVSKRIRALEGEIGSPLVQRNGRKLRLTRAGLDLLLRAKPLMAEIESLKNLHPHEEIREFSIGIADSIASSWGPAAIRFALSKIPPLKLSLHVHRSTLITENIKLGRYDLGLVAYRANDQMIASIPITAEEMIVVGKMTSDKKVLTIEPASATWRELGPIVQNHPRFAGRTFAFVESFGAAAQMAREGFGQALVPMGIANALGFADSEVSPLSPKIKRQIHLVARKTLLDLSIIKKFGEALETGANL